MLSCVPGTRLLRLHPTTSAATSSAGVAAACNEEVTSVPNNTRANDCETNGGAAQTGGASKNMAQLDIGNEIEEFEKDLQFLEFIESDDVYNIEQFITTLQTYHPISKDSFRDEVAAVVDVRHFCFSIF